MNKYSSEDYEDIFSGREEDEYSSSNDGYEDISSGRDDIEDISSGTDGVENLSPGVMPVTDFTNLAAKNRRDVYAKEMQNTKRVPVRNSGYADVRSARPAQQNSRASMPQAPQKRRGGKGGKKSKAKKVMAVILALVLLLTALIGFFGFSLLNKINYVPSEHSNLYLDSSKLMSNRRIKNILFIGCDDDSGGSQRSDSIMLVSIDKVHHKFKLTSFMRDTWVYIPDHDYAKLNAAFAYGGAGLLMDTIEYNFGIKVDNYAMVDFDIFSSIIEELGGVEVEVTQEEADFINENTSETVKSGVTKLNGDEALVYCRIRYLDSDFMRTQRQRKVMSAIVDQVKHAGPFTLYRLAEVILPQVKTDITKGEMIGIGLGVFGYLGYDIEQLRIPIDDSYTSEYFGEQQALSIDFEKNREALREFIYENE